jgi:hypothetical protein
MPLTLTPLVREPGVAIVALAVPVEAVCIQDGVPLAAVPASVKEVGPEGAVWHLA